MNKERNYHIAIWKAFKRFYVWNIEYKFPEKIFSEKNLFIWETSCLRKFLRNAVTSHLNLNNLLIVYLRVYKSVQSRCWHCNISIYSFKYGSPSLKSLVHTIKVNQVQCDIHNRFRVWLLRFVVRLNWTSNPTRKTTHNTSSNSFWWPGIWTALNMYVFFLCSYPYLLCNIRK